MIPSINGTKYEEMFVIEEGKLAYIIANVNNTEKKWLEQIGIKAQSDYFTVKFETYGGGDIQTQKIKSGKKAKEPKVPVKPGYEFTGWVYYIEEGTEDNPNIIEKEFNFDMKIDKDYTIYAIYSGESILPKRNDNEYFWKYKSVIENITFTSDASLIPSQIEEEWELKASDICSPINAYLEKTTNNLIVYSNQKIYANKDMGNYFKDFVNLKSIDFSNLDMIRCNWIYGMFWNCSELTTIDFKGFDTSNVTYMNLLFAGCSKLATLDLASFDTQNVVTMKSMFSGCHSLRDLNLSNFDTSKVNDMEFMFADCYVLESLILGSNFITENVTSMRKMFFCCYALKELNVSSFDTSHVTTMSNMFRTCKELINIEGIDKFDTKNVTDMEFMFAACNKLGSIDLSGFNTQNVLKMDSMFYACGRLQTRIAIKNPNTTYSNMFLYATNSTGFNAKIIVDYTEATSDLVDRMIETKSVTSKVEKGNLVN